MHGVTISDHGEKTATWSGYWEERQKKLAAQPVNANLYGAISSRLAGSAVSRLAGVAAADRDSKEGAPMIFKQCRIYFDGRVDSSTGLSSFALGKLARLHGADVSPHLTKKGVTHVVCTQLSGAKERAALRGATASSGIVQQYFVLPEWITRSIAARRRLCERHFSLLARIARDARISAPLFRVIDAPATSTKEAVKATHRHSTVAEPTASELPRLVHVGASTAENPPECTTPRTRLSAPAACEPTASGVVLIEDSPGTESEHLPPTELDSDEEEDDGGDEFDNGIADATEQRSTPTCEMSSPGLAGAWTVDLPL